MNFHLHKNTPAIPTNPPVSVTGGHDLCTVQFLVRCIHSINHFCEICFRNIFVHFSVFCHKNVSCICIHYSATLISISSFLFVHGLTKGCSYIIFCLLSLLKEFYHCPCVIHVHIIVFVISPTFIGVFLS
jgi:hypothetical protein